MENLTLNEAISRCRAGCFVAHRHFGSSESMHMYHSTLYYEDGANLTPSRVFDIHDEEWAQEGWYVKYPVERVDRDLLKKMHIKYGTTMCSSRGDTYERCILPE